MVVDNIVDTGVKSMNLVIVESPKKAATIKNYLGKDFNVVASIGHIRDLAINGESNLGIDLKNDFAPIYEISASKIRTVEKLKKAVSNADKIYLATDPDREGEAISWHLAQVLNLPLKTTPRLEFHEITYHAILDAVKNPRLVDLRLVQSQETRRIVDRIIGFKLSNLLQRKIDSKSAGRVQSVALKLLVDREKEITNFIKEEYWIGYINIANKTKSVRATLVKIDKEDAKIHNQEEADKIKARIPATLKVTSRKEEEKSHYSRPPFTTASLQIEASRMIKFSSSKTMKIAQQLYEGIKIGDNKPTGLITYMRTDSIRLSPIFINVCKEHIKNKYGQEYVGVAKVQKNGDNVQNAHEAIRPTNLDLDPESIKDSLTPDQFKLYELIYARTVASMMVPRVTKDVDYIFSGNGLDFSLKSSKKIFDGYSLAYEKFEKLDKNTSYKYELDQEVEVRDSEFEQKFTQPPYRYNEAGLIKELEDKGIGRPSTYATIMETIKDPARDYVTIEKQYLVPTKHGIITCEKLDEYFSSIINVDYTADMENKLDKIAEGEYQRTKILHDFYDEFIELYDYANEHMEKVEAEKPNETCPKCGKELIYRNGKYGKFIGCSGYPACDFIKKIEKPVPENAKVCPKCGKGRLVVVTGKFSPFLGCNNYPECDYKEPFKKRFVKK
jgi:DNA topoisomerase-1